MPAPRPDASSASPPSPFCQKFTTTRTLSPRSTTPKQTKPTFYGQLQMCTPSAPPIVILTPALALLPNTRELGINHKCHVWIHAPKKSKTKLTTKPSHRILLRTTELPKPTKTATHILLKTTRATETKAYEKKTSPSHHSQINTLPKPTHTNMHYILLKNMRATQTKPQLCFPMHVVQTSNLKPLTRTMVWWTTVCCMSYRNCNPNPLVPTHQCGCPIHCAVDTTEETKSNFLNAALRHES